MEDIIENIENIAIDTVIDETQNLVNTIKSKKKVISERQKLHLEKTRQKKLEKKIITDNENEKIKLLQKTEEKNKLNEEYEEYLIDKVLQKIQSHKPIQKTYERDPNKFYLFS